MNFVKAWKTALRTSSPNVSVGSLYANWAICAAAEDFRYKISACDDISDAEKKEILRITEKRVEAANKKVVGFIKWAEEWGKEL